MKKVLLLTVLMINFIMINIANASSKSAILTCWMVWDYNKNKLVSEFAAIESDEFQTSDFYRKNCTVAMNALLSAGYELKTETSPSIDTVTMIFTK